MGCTTKFQAFAARLNAFMRVSLASKEALLGKKDILCTPSEPAFEGLALELFSLQFDQNPPYRKICEARGITPAEISRWSEVPAVPTFAFKDLELSCLGPEERTAVFLSSGTTETGPSRHFHNRQSLAIYERSLLCWFRSGFLKHEGAASPSAASPCRIIALTPPKAETPSSSLVHMFETIIRATELTQGRFIGAVAEDGSWKLDLLVAHSLLREAVDADEPVMLVGTAFSFVHLLDHLAEANITFALPPGSRVLETGGYKGRSRSVPKRELHSLITARLGIPSTHIGCEYGMAELSSQAYDGTLRDSLNPNQPSRTFHFPPWARVQVISPETGCEVSEGQTGLIRIFDLANVYSAMGIQTEDLGIRRGTGFELLGRAPHSEARGCSLIALAS